MAVANFHYITRMSSGFKVYILEGQPNLRSEDRYRHMTNERVRVPAPAVYPIKRKRSNERALTLEERRERALSRSRGRGLQRPTPADQRQHTERQFSVPQSPTSTWSPTPSPTSPLPNLSQMYYAPIMDEPLDLIKKPRKEPANTEEKTNSTPASQIQMRPSVITCVSSIRTPASRCEVSSRHSSVISKSNYDHVVDEHFQRSLGASYQRASSSQQLSISVSVDDHFAKALGDKWLQIKSKSSSCSSSASTPPSSPSVTHSPPSYSHSPNQTHKESSSTSTPTSSRWSIH